ncbi:MAG: hypothetical protein LBE62_02805 [Azonexus sp.]|jgi:hypothetical protein|nr:hypothetical protein [Azonexus sp.]
MKRIGVAAILLLGALSALAGEDYPPLKDADLIFQTSASNQSSAIFAATASAFTHMGIIKNDGGKISVIEAGGTVRETPLKAWVKRGVGSRVAIYRDPGLTPDEASRVLAAARTLYGRPYDIFFSFNNKAIYCSELPWLAYQAIGVPIGKVQKIAEINVDDKQVKNLIAQRWQSHAECAERGYDFAQCFKHILDQKLVTPASIAADPRFKPLYSDYP